MEESGFIEDEKELIGLYADRSSSKNKSKGKGRPKYKKGGSRRTQSKNS